MKSIRKVTGRFVLQAGFSCNARCKFCYYRESLRKGTVRDCTTKEVKAKLREGRSLGKYMVDISGGEPTIRSDIFEIISYAKKMDYKKICLITNGIKTADKSFCKKLVDAGMNDILISTHSPIENQHDNLTQIKGSWKKIWQTVENFKDLEIEIRFNSTIISLNYKDINKSFELWKPYKPDAINLLVLNPSNETVKGEDSDEIAFTSYNEIASYILDSLNKYQKYFKIINVRWIPFCLLKGHEDKIRTMWQKIYEDEEWDPYLNIKYNKGIMAVAGSFLVGCALYGKTPKYGKRDAYTLFNEILTTFRGVYYYKHLKECKSCSLRKICPGLPRDYIKKFGKNKTKLSAYKLKKIIEDPLFYCKENKDHFESLRQNS